MGRFRDCTLIESAAVDREAGVLRGVKLLGSTSRNGREYSPRALSEAAALYRGAHVNVDHPGRTKPDAERGVQDGVGVIESATVKADGVYGDVRFLKSHPVTPLVMEAAESMPGAYGFSHNAEGRLVQRDGRTIVEGIERVRSVDLVRNPATTSGLFESEGAIVPRTVREIVSAVGPRGKPALSALLEMDAAVAEMPVDVPAEASADDQAMAAFESMALAVVRDALSGKLDLAAAKSKFGDLVKTYLKLAGKSEPAEAPDESSEEPPMESAKVKIDPTLAKLQEQVATLTRERDEARNREHARQLLESAGREVNDVRIKSLVALGNDADRNALVESWPKQSMRPDALRPARSAPLQESSNHSVTDAKSFAAAVRG